jgi:peptidoglycan/xylan/chitin deacetylase (PgdA/CDA1 family)
MMRSTGKRLLGHGLLLARLDSILLKHAAVVVMFHRVQENDGSDALTVDVAMFERYCRFFRRHFRVAPLRTLVRALERRAPLLDRTLAITFDDGYRDNFDNAAPVLEKLALPATFFVVTQWIGTDVVPRWDQQRRAHYPWMTWDHVRSLQRRGFEIGAHTRTHVDLGRVGAPEAQDEILGGRLELENQIGAPVESFAYPYGKPDNLTDANRDRVRAAGFRCCCSGFGGINRPSTDPFRLRRVPISNFYASPHQFAFDVALGRSVISS